MPTGYKLYPNMKAHRSKYAALDITVLVALATLIIFATLATIFQMQQDMLAAESATQSVSSYTSTAINRSIISLASGS
jgi:hypothetical protein